MKCTACGCEVREGDLFCGYCGGKVAWPAVEADYVNVGHPIGYGQFQGRTVYLIDNGLQQVQLPQELFLCWARMPQHIPDDPDMAALLQAACALDVASAEGRERFLGSVPYRQGFGAQADGSHAVGLGETAVAVNETQLLVWRLSDGKNTVARLARVMGISEDAAIAAVKELIGYDLVYAKLAR